MARNDFLRPTDCNERHTTGQLIQRAASRNEFFISCARIVISMLVLVRFLVLDPPLLAYLIVIPTAFFSLAYSVVFLLKYHGGSAARPWLWVSLSVDSVICSMSLLGDVLNPWSDYRGLLFLPDTALILICVFVNGLRLSAKIALFGGLVNTFSLLVLFGLDHVLNNSYVSYTWSPVTMWMIALISATIVAVISAGRTRALVEEGASESVRLDRLRRGVRSILEGHHDAYSILSSVHLNADQLIKKIPSDDHEISVLAGYLKADIQVLASCLTDIKYSSDDCIRASLARSTVILSDVMPEIVANLQESITDLQIELEIVTTRTPVQVAGGVNCVYRILINLLNNAREGDGLHKAKYVRIKVGESLQGVELSVDDNGPGFKSLDGLGGSGFIKLEGFNVGLRSVANIVHASGGRIAFDRSAMGGARVMICFPMSGRQQKL